MKLVEDLKKAFDYRYVYLLTRKRDRVICTLAVRIPYATVKEKKLHEKFDEERFVMTKLRRLGWNPLADQCKIGITNNLPRRLGDINADRLSGKTEWFEFTLLQKWLVMGYLMFYWAIWNIIALALLCILALSSMVLGG